MANRQPCSVHYASGELSSSSLFVAHRFKIGDQFRPLRLPCKSFLRKRAGCGHVAPDEWTEPIEVRGCILSGNALYRYVQTTTNGFGNGPQRYTFFGDCMVSAARHVFLQCQRIDTHCITEVHRSPAVKPVADIGRCEWRSESDIGWRRRTAMRRDCCSARRLWGLS
jgi:hypothetical protein